MATPDNCPAPSGGADPLMLAGHTLGTPDHTVPEALALFRRVGLNSAEVIWQDDYKSAIPESDASAARLIRDVARDLGVDIVALTPYVTGINSLDRAERERDTDRLRRCIDVANLLGARIVRVYAGRYQPSEPDHSRKWSLLVDSLQILGGEAEASGVTLCVENHFNTMTVTARETADLMRAVGSKGVGILYDQANLTFTHSESHRDAIRLQGPWIRHCHVKDLVFVREGSAFTASDVTHVDEGARAVRSMPVGDGTIPWAEILPELRRARYSGYLSLEYEYRWHRSDLPPPEIGLRRSVESLRTIVSGVRAAS